MLKPAILYKEEIKRNMQEQLYTSDMFYISGALYNWVPDIPDCPERGCYQYAIVNNDNKLIGLLCYNVDFYASTVWDFGLFSFDKGNLLLGRDLFAKLEELVNKFHRVEWQAVSGNPACRGYDRFIRRHNGNKHILKDRIKDVDGNYHDSLIYEIVSQKNN